MARPTAHITSVRRVVSNAQCRFFHRGVPHYHAAVDRSEYLGSYPKVRRGGLSYGDEKKGGGGYCLGFALLGGARPNCGNESKIRFVFGVIDESVTGC